MKLPALTLRIVGLVATLSLALPAAGQGDAGPTTTSAEPASTSAEPASTTAEPASTTAGPASTTAEPASTTAASSSTTRTITFEPDPAVRAEVAAHLGSGDYRFCTDEGYRLWLADKDRLCSRASAVGADCPGLQAACARPAWDEMVAEESDPGWLLNFSNFLGTFGGEIFRALFWLLLGIGALLLLRNLLRLVKVGGSSETEVAPAPLASAAVELDPTLQPASVLLERAAELLEAGDPRRALHFAYAALLAGLDRAGLVRVHRALTAGDYRRSLARTVPQSPAGGLLWDLDLARFRSAVDSDGARQLTGRVRELLGTLSPLAVLLIAFGLSGCTELADQEPPFNPNGPRGYALFEELAASRTGTFLRRLRRVTELPMDTTTVLVVPGHLRELEWATLERYVGDGGHLIVAGPGEDLPKTFGIRNEPVRCTGPITAQGIQVVAPDTPDLSLSALGPGDSEGLLARCGSSAFARIHAHGEGQLTLVGDPSIFDNTSLALSDNASFVLRLLNVSGGHMEFIGPWTGAGAVHPLESIARSSVGPWLAHLLLAVALFAWARGRRFGSPNVAGHAARRSQIEHAEALAHHYARQGDTGAALARYTNWALGLLGKRSGSSNRDLRALAESLASRRGSRGGVDAKELHQILLRARAGAELGGDKAKLMRAYGVLRTVVGDVTGKR